MEKTHWKKLRNPDYIGAYELMTGGEAKDMVVTIVNVKKEKLKTEKGEEGSVAYLKNQKPMILNTINNKNITKALGSPYIEDWVGKSITLYVVRIKAFGEQVDALRVRDTAPKEPTKEDLNPKHEKWKVAIDAIKSGSTTIEAIQKKYNVNDENLKLLQNVKA